MTGNEILVKFAESGLHSVIGHDEFSRHACEGCNSKLGGERWTVSGFFSLEHAKEGESFELEICRDCYEALEGI